MHLLMNKIADTVINVQEAKLLLSLHCVDSLIANPFLACQIYEMIC